MASRSNSVDARVSAFNTRAICSRAWRFSSSLLDATQSAGTMSRKSRMYASFAVNKTQMSPATPARINVFTSR